MRRSSLYTSAGFHGAILLIAIVGLPFLPRHEFVIPPPITVDLVEISKITQTNKVTPQPAPPKEEPKKPQPAPPPTPAPVVPEKEPPKPEEKTEPLKTEQADDTAPPEKIKKKEVKKPEPKKVPTRDFSSVLKNLDVSKEPPPAQPAGQNAPLGEKMTMSEEDALRGQLEKCWNVPIGTKDIENMTVDIVMAINPDRTLREAHVVDTGRYNSDPAYQAVADSALRAVRSPLCSPFEVPTDKYNIWSTTTVTFNPKDMF